MNSRTVESLRRLKQSVDFLQVLTYLTEELDEANKTLRTSKDNVLMYRAQALSEFLTTLTETIKES